MSERKPRTLKELIDREREKLAQTAHDAMLNPHVSQFDHGVSVGKYQALHNFLDEVEIMMKPKDDDDDQP